MENIENEFKASFRYVKELWTRCKEDRLQSVKTTSAGYKKKSSNVVKMWFVDCATDEGQNMMEWMVLWIWNGVHLKASKKCAISVFAHHNRMSQIDRWKIILINNTDSADIWTVWLCIHFNFGIARFSLSFFHSIFKFNWRSDSGCSHQFSMPIWG